MNWNNVKTSVENLLAHQTGLLTSFSWRNSSYSGVRTNLRREDIATDAGLYDSNYAFSLLCPLSQFNGVLPENRTETITIDGKVYRVLSTDTDSIQATIRLNLGQELA